MVLAKRTIVMKQLIAVLVKACSVLILASSLHALIFVGTYRETLGSTPSAGVMFTYHLIAVAFPPLLAGLLWIYVENLAVWTLKATNKPYELAIKLAMVTIAPLNAAIALKAVLAYVTQREFTFTDEDFWIFPTTVDHFTAIAHCLPVLIPFLLLGAFNLDRRWRSLPE